MKVRIHTHTQPHTLVNLPVDQRWSSGTGSAGSRTTGNAEAEQGDILGGAAEGRGGRSQPDNTSQEV